MEINLLTAVGKVSSTHYITCVKLWYDKWFIGCQGVFIN